MGIQTAETNMLGYQGVETSANAAGGLIGQFGTQAYQATYYKQMLQLLACDPNVRVINIFHLVDEPSLSGWQSGLYFFGDPPVPKQSASVVAGWIAQTGGACQGKLTAWYPAPLQPPAVAKSSSKPGKPPKSPKTPKLTKRFKPSKSGNRHTT
jgi:hypothetical protein